MIRALLTAASGMKAQQLQVDTVANNIANVNTAGFKKSQLSFRSMLYQTMREPGAPTAANLMNPTGLQVGSGTEVSGSLMHFAQGELEPTGAMLDIAIQGEGFFRIRLPSGEFRYTRDGTFRVDGTGQIVTTEGHVLETAPTIPQDVTSVIFGEDGTISAITNEGQPPSQIGTLSLFRFPNPAGLKAQGGNLYSESASSGAARQVQPAQTGNGVLRQGFRERSNVQVVEELVALILAQRNYEVNSRAIRVSDEMLQQVNQMVR
jgi:flagellar basal-body rod protein FlgG